jgi:hypothetical protein
MQNTDAAGDTGRHPAPAHAWLGKLATYIASFAGGMAVNDVSGTVGYPGLAGAVALSGVVTAAVWIRGLDPHARLARYAPPIFLLLAGCAAGIAAFSSGSTVSYCTGTAVVLTVGAVLIANELDSAATLLIGGGTIAVGVAIIAVGIAYISNAKTLLGAAFIAGGTRLVTIGLTRIADRKQLVRVPGRRQSVARWVMPIFGVALIASGAVFIGYGAVLAGVGAIAAGVGSIARGVATVGTRNIVIRARQMIEWATKAPYS